MRCHGWHMTGTLLLAAVLSGCATITPAASPRRSARPPQQSPVTFTFQQTQGHLTLRVQTLHPASSSAAHQLQGDLQQLNQLLTQLQNP
jgi:uncharacterized protein YceK